MVTSRWELLFQDEIWIDGQGREERLDEMDDKHLVNLKGWLLRNATVYQDQVFIAMYQSSLYVGGEAASDAIDMEMDALSRTSPVIWMERQELFQAINRNIDERLNDVLGDRE